MGLVTVKSEQRRVVIPAGSAVSEPRADQQRIWKEFERWEREAANRGSGMTREQITGATMMLMWLFEQGTWMDVASPEFAERLAAAWAADDHACSVAWGVETIQRKLVEAP